MCEVRMKCCLCNEDAGKYGNNADPITNGRCCDLCDLEFVIPERIHRIELNERLKILKDESLKKLKNES